MTKLTLRIFPDPVLRGKAKQVKDFAGMQDTVANMARTMYESGGVGLAAPQVGSSLRLFVIDVGCGLREFVNPRILSRSRAKLKMDEGCLSVPGVNITVIRPGRVKVMAQNARGEFFTEEFEGMAARAIQHENDHLDGKLIVDYLDPIRYFLTARRFRSTVRKKRTCEVVCNDGKRAPRCA